jgi:hypothetical protein
MPRLLLALSLLLLAPAGALAAPHTRAVRVSPVDASGHLRSGYRVAHRARAACQPGSEAVPGAYRCFGNDNLIRDPCWRASAHVAFCLAAPWQRRVTRLRVHGGFGAPLGGRASLPWGVRLRDGERCVLMQGASDVIRGKRVNYGCSRTSFLIGRPDRGHAAWRIQRARLRAGRFVAGARATIATAYYGRSG